MNSLYRWVEDRTGITALMHEALFERVPGGARWRYVWGSTLVFAFAVQMITGLFLWMSYSPSSQTAWESTYYIQHEMQFGWLLRGLHHYMAQTMIVLLVLHLMQVVIDGAYRAPREFNFWLGLILMQVVLGLALTGYLLPWDQRGYWSTGVATSLMSLVPFVGEHVQKLVIGGSDYGHHTLTRFFALHAGLLPAVLIGFLVLHVAIFRKHGIHPKKLDPKKDCYFWPDQVLKDAVACLAVLCAVLFCIFMPLIFGDVTLAEAKADPGAHLGAHLTAPADASNKFSAARPEWYFLFLFQFLKFFHGEDAERIGALYIPGAVMGVLFLMPILGRWKLGHRFNIAFLFILMGGAGFLTAQAWFDDNMAAVNRNVDFIPGFKKTPEKVKASEGYIEAVRDAEEEAHRAVELVSSEKGIPAAGAVSLLRGDAKTQGHRLFKEKCASCHNYSEGEGKGIYSKSSSAPNLYEFGSTKWIAGVLSPEQIDGPDYFGNTKHKKGDMSGFVHDEYVQAGKTDAEKKAIQEEIQAVSAALAKVAGIEGRMLYETPELTTKRINELITKGNEILNSEEKCAQCHKVGDKFERFVAPAKKAGEADEDPTFAAPDLRGYGSREWLTEFIADAAHPQFYGTRNDRMPAFAKDRKDSKNNQLSENELKMLVEWLRGEWYKKSRGSETAAH